MKEKSRQKAIKSAKKLMMDKGKDGVRMQEIADHAGINKGLLHYYFKSKDNLFREVFLSEFSKVYGDLNAILATYQPLEEKLGLMIDRYYQLLWAEPNLPSFVLFEINKNPDLISDLSDRDTLHSTILLLDQEFKQNGIISSPSFAFQVILNIISMCVFPFMMRPVINDVGKKFNKNWESVLTERKDFLKTVIINSFRY